MDDFCRKCRRTRPQIALLFCLISSSFAQSYKDKIAPQLIYKNSSEYNPPRECYDKTTNDLLQMPICELLPNHQIKIVGTHMCSSHAYNEVRNSKSLTQNDTSIDEEGKPENKTTPYLELYDWLELEIWSVLNGTDKYVEKYVDWLYQLETRKGSGSRQKAQKDDAESENSDEQLDSDSESLKESEDESESDDDDDEEEEPEPDLSYKRVTREQALEYLAACDRACVEKRDTSAKKFSKYEDVKFIHATYIALNNATCCGPQIFKRKVPCTLDEFNHLNRVVKSLHTASHYQDNYFNKRKGEHFGTVFLSSVFLGVLGVDRFLMNYRWQGLFKMATLGGLGLWWIVDIFLLIHGQFVPADHSNWNPFV